MLDFFVKGGCDFLHGWSCDFLGGLPWVNVMPPYPYGFFY
jgi:hypothetical protein